jgi:hypothetical protein
VRRDTQVSIYERVKYGAKWRRKKVAVPALKANGSSEKVPMRIWILEYV